MLFVSKQTQVGWNGFHANRSSGWSVMCEWKEATCPQPHLKTNWPKNYGASLTHEVFNYSIQHSRLKYGWLTGINV